MPGNSVDALNVKITADISRLQTGLKKCTSLLTGLQMSTSKSATKMRSSFDKVDNAAKKLATAIGTAFTVNQIKKIAESALEAASDLVEVQNVVDTVFGSMSESVNDWAKTSMTAFGLSETLAKQFASTMGAMLKSSVITGDALKTMSINMAALSADMASFYNLDVETAFNKIRAGLAGEVMPLRQLGINMSVANMEAYALSQGITKTYDAMSQSEQMILRYNYLLSVTADAQHDFERTSSGWANQTRILSENFNRLETVIGQGLIQALTPLLNMFNALIAKVIEFAQALMKAFGVGGDDSGSLSGAATDAADTADGLEDADKAAKKLNNTLGGIDELNIVSDNASSGQIDDMANALGGLSPISVYDTTSKAIEGISEKMTALVDKLKEKLEPVASLVGTIKEAFEQAFESEAFDRLIDHLKEGLWGAAELVGTFAEAFDNALNRDNAGADFLNSIIEAFDEIIQLANDVGTAISNALKSDAGAAWMDSLISKWQSLVDMIKGIATGIREAWNDGGAGQQYIESILEKWASINNFIAAVQETIGKVFASETGKAFFATIIDLCTTWNNIVSMVFDTFTEVWNAAGLGESIITGIVSTITNLIGFVSDLGKHFQEAWEQNETGQMLVQAVGNAIDSVIGLVQRLSSSWRSVWDNDTTTTIFSGILSIITQIVSAVGNMANAIKNALSSTDADTQIFTAIQDAISGIISAASRLASALSNALAGVNWQPVATSVANLASAISQVVQAAAGLASGVLAAFGEALTQAFNDTMAGIINAVAKALEVVASVLNHLNPNVVITLATAFLAFKSVEGIASVFTSLGTVINGVKTAMSTAKSIASATASVFSNLASVVSGAGGSFTQALGAIVLITAAITALVVAVTKLLEVWRDLNSTTSNTTTSVSEAASMLSTSASAMSTSSLTPLTTASIPQAATGGIFGKGDLFIANERGPELVGGYGGNSAVMNNEQIVDAVSSGVSDALSPLVDAITSNQSQPTVKIRGNDLLLIMQRAQKQRGSIISNNFAFGGA